MEKSEVEETCFGMYVLYILCMYIVPFKNK